MMFKKWFFQPEIDPQKYFKDRFSKIGSPDIILQPTWNNSKEQNCHKILGPETT